MIETYNAFSRRRQFRKESALLSKVFLPKKMQCLKKGIPLPKKGYMTCLYRSMGRAPVPVERCDRDVQRVFSSTPIQKRERAPLKSGAMVAVAGALPYSHEGMLLLFSGSYSWRENDRNTSGPPTRNS